MIDNINIEEFKEILNYVLDNNIQLRKEKKKATSIELIGDSGLGKTSAIIQLAESRSIQCVKINLSQLEELGDIVGFPLKEYELIEGEIKKWVSIDILNSYKDKEYILTGNTRMGYAPPQWLPKDCETKPGILLLDDYSRAQPRFIQATMEIIDRNEYISWKLPDSWTVVMTSNPDNGSYSVSSLDNAQKTRYISFELDFDIKVWAKWAEEYGIDSRGINFCLSYPDIFEVKKGNEQTINPRSIVTFFNTIQGIKDWSNTKNLALILNIAKGCFTSKENVIGHLFTTFIANKLDKLMTPEEMCDKNWDSVKSKLKSCIYDGENYRADIASVLSTRFLNYTLVEFNKKGTKTDPIVNRILDFINSDVLLLSEDLIFNLIKTLHAEHPSRINKLLMNPKITSKIC